MPELPDVQVFKRYMDATALHTPVRRTEVPDAVVLANTTAQGLGRIVKGETLERTRRHGKHLLVQLSSEAWLSLHFGMTGSLRFYRDADRRPDTARLVLHFADGALAYDCPRKLGRIEVTDSPEALAHAHDLGPDALRADRATFRQRIGGRRGGVKSALTNQSALAGVGNVYGDEVLFQARIHPERRVPSLDGGDLDRLHRTLRRVLRRAIQGKVEDFPRGWLIHRRSPGAACPRCGGEVKRIRVSGRSTYVCEACQTPPD